MTSRRQVGIDLETGADPDIIGTGQSMSQRDRRERLTPVNAAKDGISIEEISEVTSMGEEFVKNNVEHFKERGEIYAQQGELREA